MEKIIGTSEASNYLGISSSTLRRRIEPLKDDKEEYIKKGREFVYSAEEVEKLKSEMRKEKIKEDKFLLRQEDLTPEKKKELHICVITASAWGRLSKKNADVATQSEEEIKKILGEKRRYEGDDIIKSLTFGYSIEKNVISNELEKYFSEEELKQTGIITPKYDANILIKKGPELVKKKLKDTIKKFEEFCKKKKLPKFMTKEKFEEVRKEFIEEQGLPFPVDYQKRLIEDYMSGNLNEERYGEYTREIAQSCIKVEQKSRSLRPTLQDKIKEEIEKIVEERAKKIKFSELDEMTKRLEED